LSGNDPINFLSGSKPPADAPRPTIKESFFLGFAFFEGMKKKLINISVFEVPCFQKILAQLYKVQKN
ncbi:MAG TPA: hypothetical protein VK106_03035, partial [Balneolaceae bacterium]|nr:hypothetical protein [Balneolaceae bacterium]